MKAPRGRCSPLSACLLTCSGRTQYALPEASPADQALEWHREKAQASRSVASPAFEPSLMTQEGAPWMSACAYRSPSFRCFLTTASFVFASRPPITRNPSEEIIHRYASNQNAFVGFGRSRAFFTAFSTAFSAFAIFPPFFSVCPFPPPPSSLSLP